MRGPSDPRVRWLLGLILGLGFLLRLTYLLEVRQAPDFDAPQFESQYHDYWARALVTDDWTPPAGVTDPEILERPYFRPPGYPWFLAAVYGTLGAGYLVPRAIQMLIGLASCLLIFSLGHRWYGAATGLFATGLMAVYWLFIFFEGELMEPPLLIFLLLAALWTIARWADAWTASRALGAGVLLGIAALVRPNVLVLLPAVLIWALWTSHRRGRAWTDLWKPALLFTASMLIAVLPATLRNGLVTGDWVLVTSNAGINLFVGSHPDGDGYTPGVPELAEISGLTGWDSFDYPKIADAVVSREGHPMKDSEVSRFFTERAVKNALDNPEAVLALTIRKLALFWGPAEVSNNKVLLYERQSSPTLLFGPGFATVFALALTGLALLGFELVREASPRKLEVTVLLVAFVAVYSASFLPFFAAARFRAPIVPILILFAGFGLGWLWRAAAERRWQALGLSVALLLGLRGLTGISWIPYEDDLALWHWRKGILYEARGNLDRAILEFRDTLAAQPDHEEARISLASALAATGQMTAAINEYRQALVQTPSSVSAHNNLGMLLAQDGDVDGAIDHWETALRLDAERVSVLANLAFALSTREPPDIERALELVERACTLTDEQDPRLLSLRATLQASGSGS